LDPRPDSEVIISASLDLLPDKAKAYRFLDLGCGTGCLLFSLLYEFTNATGIATDISAETLKVTQANMELLKLENRAMLLNQNLGDSLSKKVDLIVSNHPYIHKEDISDLEPVVKFFDPLLALDGGVDGLDHYRYLSGQIITLLKPGAYAILEFGFGQCDLIKEIFINQGYLIEKVLIDLSGIERAIIVKANI
jgi:release factor glutamine methyltransferase